MDTPDRSDDSGAAPAGHPSSEPASLVAVIAVIALMAVLLVVASALGGDDPPSPPAPTTASTTTTIAPTTTSTTIPPTTTTSTTITTSTTSTSTTSTTTTTTDVPVEPARVARVGEAIELADGALARVDAVDGVTDPARTIAEVEVCAGSSPFEVNALAWSAVVVGERRAAAVTGHDLVAATLAPGGCARGWVDLDVVPDGSTDVVVVEAVVLVDETFDEVARWTTADIIEPTTPLAPGVEPVRVPRDGDADLADGALATVLSVGPIEADEVGVVAEPGRALFELVVQQCAGTEPLDVDPVLWSIVATDHYVGPGLPDLGTLGAVALEPGACVDGTVIVDFVAGAEPADALLFAFDDLAAIEIARFALGG